MPLMKLDQKDPHCPTCIANTTVELIAGSPCQIKVHVVLASNFPGSSEAVTYAALKVSDDDGNTYTKVLGPPTGPDYGDWEAGTNFDIQFNAQSWLTSSDFPNTTARLEVRTNQPRTVFQWWAGLNG